ncbi:hypothetical protein, partial [Mycobacterium tuberculosis]
PPNRTWPVCDLPVTSAAELATALGVPG